jgi:phage-related protein
MVRQGLDGRHMPTFTFNSEPVFTYPGEVLRSVLVNKREIIVPLVVYGTDADDLRTNLRALQASFNPMNGAGSLQVVTDEASPRTFQIDCCYESGMTFQENTDTGNYKTRIFVATFIAHSPYWYDPTPSTHNLTNGSNPITYYGDVDTYPVITVTGPIYGGGISITNSATGKSIAWVPTGGTFYAGDELYINCIPGQRTVCVSTGNCSGLGPWPAYTPGRAAQLLSATSSMNFNLVPGTNTLTWSGGNVVTMTFYNQYNGI